LKASRGALLADLHPLAGVLRFTLGATSNQFKLSLDASGAGSIIDVGGKNYLLGAGAAAAGSDPRSTSIASLAAAATFVSSRAKAPAS
jgi:hypothetical protein